MKPNNDKAKTLDEKLVDPLMPGSHVEFDPEEAEQAGAFIEDALSEEDAMESDIGLKDATIMTDGNEGKE